MEKAVSQATVMAESKLLGHSHFFIVTQWQHPRTKDKIVWFLFFLNQEGFGVGVEIWILWCCRDQLFSQLPFFVVWTPFHFIPYSLFSFAVLQVPLVEDDEWEEYPMVVVVPVPLQWVDEEGEDFPPPPSINQYMHAFRMIISKAVITVRFRDLCYCPSNILA